MKSKNIKKNLQWWGALIMLLGAISGCAFAVYTIYFGITMKNADQQIFKSLMDEYNMNQSQLMNAVIVVASVVLVIYILMGLCAALGLLTYQIRFKNRTLFWIGIVLLILDGLMFALGSIDLWLFLFTGLGIVLFSCGVYQNFSPRIRQAFPNSASSRKRKKKSSPRQQKQIEK